MTWIAFKGFVSKSWLWLKHYWQIPLLVLWTFAVYFFARRNTEALIDVMDARKDSYDKQLKELKSRHEHEILERNRLIQEYHTAVARIEKKYEEREKRLTKKEKQRVKEIVKKSKGEPSVIKREIEKSFGFTYID